MQKIRIEHKDFKNKKLEIVIDGFFCKWKMFLNDQEIVPAKRGLYSVTNDLGDTVEVKQKISFLDPVPYFSIAGEDIRIVEKFSPLEIIVAVLPIGLLARGGALGGGLGAGFALLNGIILRNYRDQKVLKYILCILMTATSEMAFVLLRALLLKVMT